MGKQVTRLKIGSGSMSVRLGLLGLISEKPRHGYDLHQSFMALVGGQKKLGSQKSTNIYNFDKA